MDKHCYAIINTVYVNSKRISHGWKCVKIANMKLEEPYGVKVKECRLFVCAECMLATSANLFLM